MSNLSSYQNSSNAGDLVLYNYFRSSTSYRARIALHYKHLPFIYKPVHLLKDGGEQHKSEYRKINPLGEVPSLIHRGRIISQSFVIIEYLNDIFPDQPLYPQDVFLKAKIKQFCENINAYMHTLGNLKVQQYLEKNGFSAEQKQAWVNHWLSDGLNSLEILLQEFSGKYCFGDEFSMADIFLAPQVFTCNRFKVDLTPFPLVKKINDNILKLDAVQKAHPFHQIDTPEEEK